MDTLKFNLPTAQPRQSLKEKLSRLPCDPSADTNARRLVDSYRSLVVWRPEGAGPVEAAAIPNEAERQALAGRLVRLDDTLLPASTTQDGVARVAAAVSAMLGGGYTSLQNVDKRTTIAGYTEALQDLPAWAVEKGCDNVRKGKVDDLDPKWPPTHAHLHQIAERELAAVRVEKSQIIGVLALQLPPKPDEAELERMNAAAKAWLDRTDPVAQRIAGRQDSGESAAAMDANAERLAGFDAKEIEREWLAAGLEPRPYSLSLAKSLGADPTKQEGEAA